MRRSGPFARLFPLALLGLLGCAKTMQASTTQPNPLTNPREISMESAQLQIKFRDMEAPKYCVQQETGIESCDQMWLKQKASFQIVSRDRLRFKVALEHKWEELTDVRTWNVKLIDDQGRIYLPERTDQWSNRHKTKVWDYERQTAFRNQFGDITALRQDGWKDRTTLASVDFFRGLGDYSFYKRDIFNRGVKRLTLVMSRDDLEYKFTWNFTDHGTGELTPVSSTVARPN
jgi:hypothetical protein